MPPALRIRSTTISSATLLLKFAGLQFAHGVVRQSGEGGKNFGFVLGVGSDEQIDVHRSTNVVCSTKSKASPDDITCAPLIQLAAELPQILNGRLAGF